jgi:hypothetical protein
MSTRRPSSSFHNSLINYCSMPIGFVHHKKPTQTFRTHRLMADNSQLFAYSFVPFSFPFIHAQSFDSLSLASSYLPRSALALNCCIRETENPPSPAANSNQLRIGYGRPLCAKPFPSAYIQAVATTRHAVTCHLCTLFLLAAICLSCASTLVTF